MFINGNGVNGGKTGCWRWAPQHPSASQTGSGRQDQWLGICSSYPFVGSAGACVTLAIHTAPFLGGRLLWPDTNDEIQTSEIWSLWMFAASNLTLWLFPWVCAMSSPVSHYSTEQTFGGSRPTFHTQIEMIQVYSIYHFVSSLASMHYKIKVLSTEWY